MKLFEIRPAGSPAEDGDEGLVRNENGAMLLMGIFMVMFVAAMLYYVVGVGDTIMYRERMQDAADAGAMTGAVFLARGMNLITLLNLTLASVFGVLVAAQTAVFILLTAAGLASKDCNPPARIAPCFSALCLLIATGRGCDKVEEAKDIVSDAAAVTTAMQETIKAGAPLAATAVVFEMGMDHYDPPVQIPLGIYGDGMDLPVEEDPNPPICDRTTQPLAKGGFSVFSWLLESQHGYELADDLGGSCGGGYVDDARASGLFWSIVSCAMHASEVDNELYRVETDAELGDQHFQFHTLMTGEPAYGLGEDNAHDERVGVATTWSEDTSDTGIWGPLRELSRFSFAQAEFLFDDDKDREDWLWELKWRARLRRFQCSDIGALDGVCIEAIDAVVSH